LGKTAASPLLEAYFERRAALRRFFQAKLGASAAEADDLLQDLYLKLAQGNPPEAIASPGAYLYRLANNLTLDRARANRRALQRDAAWRLAYHRAGPAEDLADLPEADAALMARERLAKLMKALDTLPPQTQRVFRLHKFDGLSYGETAERLGVSKSAVEKHMTTALKRLLRVLEDQG
jgi:RNA polymerase sigma-70 factor (ECF subfamily)